MTCKQALNYIDTFSLGENGSAQLEAVEHHVGDCASCRSAWQAGQALDSGLKHLPDLEPPVDFTAAILKRIEHIPEESAAATLQSLRPVPAKAPKDRRPWAALLAGVTISFGAQAYRLIMGESTLPLFSPMLSGGTEGLIEIPQQGSPAIFVLAAGLLLYLIGLFGPSRAES